MSSTDQQVAYTALKSHFESMATLDWKSVESLEDLTPAIELYYTLVGLQQYDEAQRLFFDRLNLPTLYRFAAHRQRITWLERLFPQSVENLPADASDINLASSLNALAQSYQFSGQPGRSVPVFRRSTVIDDRWQNKKGLSIGLGNLGNALRETGDFRETIGY